MSLAPQPANTGMSLRSSGYSAAVLHARSNPIACQVGPDALGSFGRVVDGMLCCCSFDSLPNGNSGNRATPKSVGSLVDGCQIRAFCSCKCCYCHLDDMDVRSSRSGDSGDGHRNRNRHRNRHRSQNSNACVTTTTTAPLPAE